MAEVSNLTDLDEPERLQARRVLAKTISVIHEPHVSSGQASHSLLYEKLGLVDAAISIVAREQKCSVLIDDFPLGSGVFAKMRPVQRDAAEKNLYEKG